jgi:glycosyltransferase involved in cell wall biosynthesis
MGDIDVVIPCYNYARFLERSVRSVLAQEGVNVRVLVIDDASSDETPQVGKRLAEQDSRVEFRRHDVNKGHIATYNEGLLGWAAAQYCLLLSADDALAPGALERATQLMTRHPEVGMTYGMAQIIDDDTDIETAKRIEDTGSRIISGSEYLRHCCAFANPVPTPTAVVRTELQHRLGGYQVQLPHSGDMEMWMRFATQSSIAFLHSIQAYYRWHGNNMGTAYYQAALGDLAEQREACKEVVMKWCPHIRDANVLMGLLDSRIGLEAFWIASKAFDDGDLDRTRVCLRFAEEHNREIRYSGKWWRFQTKRMLGRRVWNGIRPIVRRIRGFGQNQSSLKSSHFRVGDLTGRSAGES